MVVVGQLISSSVHAVVHNIMILWRSHNVLLQRLRNVGGKLLTLVSLIMDSIFLHLYLNS